LVPCVELRSDAVVLRLEVVGGVRATAGDVGRLRADGLRENVRMVAVDRMHCSGTVGEPAGRYNGAARSWVRRPGISAAR
jgi:hypothetical protein